MALVATVGRCVLCDFGGSELAAKKSAHSNQQFIFTDSGTSALALAIADATAQSNPTADPEVIIPAYCCPDILTAVRYNNAKPILVDLEPGTPWLSLDGIAAALNKNTVAVVAVNFLGISERLEQLAELLVDHKCALVDDACQSSPALDEGTGVANYRISSFGRGKPVSLLHGGMLVGVEDLDSIRSCLTNTSAARDYRALRLRCRVFNLARHRLVFGLVHALGLAGQTRYSEPTPPGPMSDQVASILPVAIDAYARQSDEIASQFAAKLRSAAAAKLLLLAELPGVAKKRLLRYPLLASDHETRDYLIREIQNAGICATPLYRRPLPDILGTSLGFDGTNFPAAREFSRRLISLPLHGEISAAKVAKIVDILAAP